MRWGPPRRGSRRWRPIRSKHLDPATTLEVLKSMFPDAKPVVDSKAGVLLVTALPEQQANIEKVLAQLRANTNPDDTRTTRKLSGQAGVSRPSCRSCCRQSLRVRRLQSIRRPAICWYSETRSNRRRLSGRSIQLGRQGGAADRRIEVYPLQNAEPANVLAVVQKLLAAIPDRGRYARPEASWAWSMTPSIWPFKPRSNGLKNSPSKRTSGRSKSTR